MSGRTVRWLMSLARRDGRSASEPRLTIVRHHRVYADGERPLYRLGVSEHVLAAQVAMLRERGLGPVTVSEGLGRLAEGRPGHWVAMTFDDGYADNVERALPILAGAGAQATFYLTAGLMEARRAPWWDELVHALERSMRPRLAWRDEEVDLDLELSDRESRRRALARVLPSLRAEPPRQAARLASLKQALDVATDAPCELATWGQAARLVEAGMEVGAHTLTHPFLDRLGPEEQAREIRESVERIEARLGARPAGFAYPGGAYDTASIAAVRDVGLAHAVTTRAGDNRAGGSPFELARRGFDEGMCVGPGGRFSRRLARAELEGAFDGLRRARREAMT